MKIYFDNASTTPLAPEVTAVMIDILSNHYGNPSSIHNFGRKSRSIIEDARKRVAKILNASISEIFFTSSATEANNMVLQRSIIDLGVDHIISSPTEHHCVLHTLEHIRLEHPNVKISMLNVDQYGRISLEELNSLLTADSTKTLVSLMYGNNEIGTIHPIEKISELCQSHSAFFHCDAVQMVGKYPIDLQKIQLSFMTGTAHKFHGPKGNGFLYMNGDNIISPFIHGGAQERNMRAGTENVAGIAGLAKALEAANIEMEQRRDYVSGLKARFDQGIENYKGCYLNCPSDLGMYHISSVSFPESDTVDMLMFNLDINGISASSGSACSAGIEEDSHVLVAIGHPTERKTIRFSFSSFNTEEEVDHALAVIRKLV
jgi:cysteine desulfurase